MPFFENASGSVTIIDSPMTNVKGNMYHYDHSKRTTNNDSYNTTTRNTADSYNNSSKLERGNKNVYNNRTNRRVLSGVTHVNVRGKTIPNWGTELPHSPPSHPNTTSARKAPPQNIEGESYEYQHSDCEKGPQFLEERQPPSFGNTNPPNVWQEGYAPTGRGRRDQQNEGLYQHPTPPEIQHEAYSNTGYPSRGNYDMECDSQQEYASPPSPHRSSSAQASKNPSYAVAQQPQSPFPPPHTATTHDKSMHDPRAWSPNHRTSEDAHNGA